MSFITGLDLNKENVSSNLFSKTNTNVESIKYH